MPKEVPQSGLPFFLNGLPVVDAVLRVVDTGTNTPKAVFSDPDLNTLLPNPVPMKAEGYWPAMYVDAGLYDARIEDGTGHIFIAIEGLRGGDQASGGGGGGGVDATTIAQTGDVKDRYGTGTHAGWVRMNGRTIGSAGSSASERASADCHSLFVYLWNADAVLAVSSGRGTNAESDWAANKTIALPDARGRFRAALDDMGAAAAGRLAGGLFGGGTAVSLGSYGGAATHSMVPAELAPHYHDVTVFIDNGGLHFHTGNTDVVPDHVHPGTTAINKGASSSGGGLGSYWQGGDAGTNTGGGGAHFHPFTTAQAGLHSHNATTSVATVGSGTPFNTLPPFLLVTSYVKL